MAIEMMRRMEQTAYEEKLKRLDHLDVEKAEKGYDRNLQNMKGAVRGIKSYCWPHPSIAEIKYE